jgi:hypothetical protein
MLSYAMYLIYGLRANMIFFLRFYSADVGLPEPFGPTQCPFAQPHPIHRLDLRGTSGKP